jgi:ribosomal protein S18 acetylase RimI-like enzyme
MGASQTELNDNTALEIERIYVTQAYQGKKVGQKLYEKAIQVAKDREVEYIWLGVWEENHKAIRFYTKNGFTAFDKHIFKLGDDVQTDIMMKLTI